MARTKRPTLKEELAAAQKANTVLNTDFNALKVQHEALKTNLLNSQVERLRLEALLNSEIELLESLHAGSDSQYAALKERAKYLRKENQPR